MVDFIVCDDCKETVATVVEVINKCMMNNNIQYKTHKFYDYNDNFIKIMNEPLNHKIYILDIATPSGSGIDIARDIREKDKTSVLIFLTGHDELGSIILKICLNILTFVSKFDGYELKLKEAIQEGLKLAYSRNSVSFLEHGTKYNIPVNNILYITRDTIERKTIIVTEATEYKVYIPIEKLNKLANGYFFKTHKSCLVNMNRVDKIDGNRNMIYFDNGTKIDLLSNKYKKDVLNYECD